MWINTLAPASSQTADIFTSLRTTVGTSISDPKQDRFFEILQLRPLDRIYATVSVS